jgi:membrane protease YdiL (CAAX protease family)
VSAAVAPAATTTGRTRRFAGNFPTVGLLAMGVTLLLLRPFALGRPGASFILAAAYVALAATSLAPPLRSQEPQLLVPVMAFGVGAGAILLAGLVAGPHLPVPVAGQAFVLNSLAAVSEEAFFRRFLFDRLTPFGPAAAVLLTAFLFALIHVHLYGMPAVWVDLGAGLLLSWQRWATGRWTTSAATHVLANLVAVIR